MPNFDGESDGDDRVLLSPRHANGSTSGKANGVPKLSRPVGGSSTRAGINLYENFESLDYEVCDNTVYKAHEASESATGRLLYRTTKYGICAALGIIVAFTAFLVNFGVENIAGLRYFLMFKASEFSYFGAWLVLTLCQLALCFLAVACVMFIGPAAAGSGIPDVQAYLNGVDVPAILLFRTLVAKVVGSLGSVGGGLAVGKEGPFVHIGACIASLLSQGGTWERHPKLKWLKRFKNDRERRDIVTCGSSAGVAAAFRAPVGGLLFGLEAMSSHWSQHLLLTCFFTTAVVSVTARVLMRMCSSGGCGFFGEGSFIIFHISDAQENYEYYELFPMLLVAILGGLLGSLFNYANTLITEWRKRVIWIHGNRSKLIDALVIAAITSTVTFVLPLFVSCKPCPTDADGNRLAQCPRQDNSHSGNFVSFNCARPDEYNDLATLFFNTQDDAIRNLFSSKTPHEYSKASLLIFFLAFYGLTLITYGIAVPAGLFVPGILVGASYGRLVGLFVRHLHPQSAVDEGTYALLGSASYMAGSMRLAVSVCVMLLELTNNLNLLPLIMLVLVFAKAVGDGTGVPGVYDIQIAKKHFPFMKPAPSKQLRHITAGELLAGQEVVCFNRVEQVGTIVSTLQQNQHNGFPVLDDSSTSISSPSIGGGVSPPPRGGSALMGIVLRHHLIVLLQTGRSFQHTPSVTPNSARIAFMHDITDFDKPVSTESPTIADIVPRLSAQAMSMYIDLAPYVNPPSFIVQESTTASKVFDLFRTLGLRHLCVVPRQPTVVGILSRQDFMEEHADRIIQSRIASCELSRSPPQRRRRSVSSSGGNSSKSRWGRRGGDSNGAKPGRVSVLRSKANLE